jgi:hypothetical protein
MGVSSIAGTDGCTIDPPAAKEYAVDPVGVAIIRPSACVCIDDAYYEYDDLNGK